MPSYRVANAHSVHPSDRLPGKESWSPTKKISQQLQSDCLALFRMKLCADKILAPDNGCNRAAIVRRRQDILHRPEFEGMHEIGVRVFADAGKNGVRPLDLEFVPPDVRNLKRGVSRCQTNNFAFKPTKSRCVAELASYISHQLHSDTNAEKRRAFDDDGIVYRLHH